MKVLVTGSRSWDDAKTIHAALNAIALGVAQARGVSLTILHGACPNGADELADQWVRYHHHPIGLHVTAERHPALWRRFGKRAGMVRNELMVATRPDLVLAFIRDNSPGATHCAELAMEVGIPMRLWRYGEPGVESFDSRHVSDEEVADAARRDR